MKSHVTIKAKGKPLVLPEDFSLDIDDQNPLFNDTEMFSYPVQIPLEGNRFLVGNVDSAISDIRPVELEHTPMRIIVDGLPFRGGSAVLADDDEVDGALSMNIDSGSQSFDDLIGDLSCRDIPVKDKIQIGEKIGNLSCEVTYDFHAKVTYKGKKGDKWYSSDKPGVANGTFEPQALGFSYPGICVTADSKQKAVQKSTLSYPNKNSVVVPKVQQSFINVSDAYPTKPYCNARVCYKHYGLNDDGTTSDSTISAKDSTNTNEDAYPYWVLDADRPQSGICFYVLYFLDCLFKYLGVSFDNSALTEIGDMNRLCFFTTHCKYDTVPIHGEGEKTYIWKQSTVKGAKGSVIDTTDKICLGAFLLKGNALKRIDEYYFFSDSMSDMPIIPLSETELNGWSKSPLGATADKPYIWNVEMLTYSDGTKTVCIPHFLCQFRAVKIVSVAHQYAPADNTTREPSTKWSSSVPEWEDAKPFFTNIDDINSWLDSRGCGGRLTFEDEKSKDVTSFTIYYNDGSPANTYSVGVGDIAAIAIESKAKTHKISGNILAMYANNENFPDESVSTIIKSLENSFGIKFHYDYEQKKVTAYLLRKVFRNQSKPIDFPCRVISMNKVNEKITGVRMCYSEESDTKEQRQNIKQQKKDYNTDYDYIEYPRSRTVVNKVYGEMFKSLSSSDMNVYVDKTTGNAYRVKVDSEAKDANSMHPVLFEVGAFKGVELGDCSTINEDYVQEFSSDFVPMVFNDVNYQNEISLASGTVSGVDEKGKRGTVSNINSKRQQPILSAFIDEDMEHEFVLQKIRNLLSTSWADFYLTEELRLRESYDPSKTDDGNSPLQSYDWGLAVAIMRGGGTDSTIENYAYDYDGFGNSKWRTVSGRYALTSDSIDMLGNEFDYNGVMAGIGGEERFSLKIRAFKQPDWSPVPLCNPDRYNSDGTVETKIRTRGLFDTFMSEFAHFLLNRKKYRIKLLASAAAIADIPNHWRERYRINGVTGYINKVSYSLSATEGIKDIEIEFYAL